MASICELPDSNATGPEIEGLLARTTTIAVVGLSPKTDRDSYRVSKYLQEHGFRIIPVNPQAEEILGEKVYASLRDITEPIDIVDIFRKPEAIGPIVEDAIAVNAKAIWMQEGIVNNAAAERAREAGLTVVMDRCILKEHASLAARR